MAILDSRCVVRYWTPNEQLYDPRVNNTIFSLLGIFFSFLQTDDEIFDVETCHKL